MSGLPEDLHYSDHVQDELVCGNRKKKCLGSNVRALVGEVKELDELWDTLDTCYDWLKKYIAKAVESVIRFSKYKVFEHTAIREFYFLLRCR
jgi:hypothetical protein